MSAQPITMLCPQAGFAEELLGGQANAQANRRAISSTGACLHARNPWHKASPPFIARWIWAPV